MIARSADTWNRPCSTGLSPFANRNVIRCGFSLMELILVLAVLLAFASLTMPVVNATFSRQALIKGADLCRASMGQARVKAIKTGKIHAVFYAPGTSYLSVAPFDNYQAEASRAQQRIRQLDSRQTMVDFDDDILPRGVKFAAGEVEVTSRAAEALSTGNGGGSLRPILFYPDGTSQNAEIVLQNEQGNMIQVILRGLTGTSTTSKIQDRRR